MSGASNITHKLLAKDEQTYFSLQVGCIRILDSCRFVSGDLASIAEKLKPEECHVLNALMPGVAVQKGYYPYEYLQGHNLEAVDALLQQENPPLQSQFYTELKQKTISDEDYDSFLKSWEFFKCTNLMDYTMKYLRLDGI